MRGCRIDRPEPTRSGVTEIFVQWKGTNACVDFYCDCKGGTLTGSHIDGDFMYFLRCPYCFTVWRVPTVLKLSRAEPHEHDMVIDVPKSTEDQYDPG